MLINYTENFDLIPGPSQVIVTNHGGMDCLVAIYEPDGTYLDYYNIFKTAGSTNDPSNSDEQAFDMTVTDSRIFVVGRFKQDFYFQIQNQSSEIHVGDFFKSLFVAQLDIASAGGIQYAWATTPLSSSDMDPSDFEDTKIYYNPSDGDLYLSGRFYGSFDFSSSSSLSTNDGEGDIFFGKVDGGNGDYLWAKALKSTSDSKESSAGILVNPTYGYIYLAGTFNNAAPFNMNPNGGNALTSSGGNDIFLGLYNSSGTLFTNYYNKIGSNLNDSLVGFDIDGSGNIYLAANNIAGQTIDVDIKSGTQNLSAGSGDNSYIVKYGFALDYYMDINLESLYDNRISQMRIDVDNNICVMGWFDNTLDMNPNGNAYNLTSSDYHDLYFGKYNSVSGEKKIVKSIVDISDEIMLMGVSKNAAEIILYGKYTLSTDFNPGPGVFYSSPVSSLNGRYFAKYDHCLSTTITTQPLNEDICEDANLAMYVSASGTGLSYKWLADDSYLTDVSGTYGDIYGSNTTYLSINHIKPAAGGMDYNCEVISSCDDPVFSNYGAVEVTTLPEITSQPGDITQCEGTNVNFTISASSVTSYQWLVNNGSGSFQAITDDATYSGSTTQTLTITNIQPQYSYYQYKCYVAGDCEPSLTSDPALLVVNPNPNIQTQPNNSSVCVGSSTTCLVLK